MSKEFTTQHERNHRLVTQYKQMFATKRHEEQRKSDVTFKDIIRDLTQRLWEGPIKGLLYLLILGLIIGGLVSLIGL